MNIQPADLFDSLPDYYNFLFDKELYSLDEFLAKASFYEKFKKVKINFKNIEKPLALIKLKCTLTI